MAAQLRVYPLPGETDEFESPAPTVRVRLADLLPLVALGHRQNYLWLKDFLDEACELAEPTVEVNATDIFKHYKLWAERRCLSDRERLSQTAFGRKLSERFEKDRDKQTGVFYRGLARRPVAEIP